MELMNAVYVGAGQPVERVLNARQLGHADKGIPLPQTTLRGAVCDFQPGATVGAFISWLRYATHFTPTAQDLNPATPWEIEVYGQDLKAYAAASEAYRQRAEGPRQRVEPKFQKAMSSSKELETRGVAWRPNEIWYTICDA